MGLLYWERRRVRTLVYFLALRVLRPKRTSSLHPPGQALGGEQALQEVC
jgi:hypothetical protein